MKAGLLALMVVRRARPGISYIGIVLVALCFIVALVAAAVGALDAGNG